MAEAKVAAVLHDHIVALVDILRIEVILIDHLDQVVDLPLVEDPHTVVVQ